MALHPNFFLTNKVALECPILTKIFGHFPLRVDYIWPPLSLRFEKEFQVVTKLPKIW